MLNENSGYDCSKSKDINHKPLDVEVTDKQLAGLGISLKTSYYQMSSSHNKADH
ncbi:hypothetical protein SERLA73DRAFT_80480 [Serpula lacrymans var. lacrymans S7.3]|uniref:Uncharacterized protein n=1 Tax=Serpula lacrymans var. lacrymans (strain S7.3) TaxID=936435 RepID=F8QJT5_SERL3|nr:hypothetical protein SERLA73DRAFT_80480 [Serpula lacrymans var. lacrymans S7.3]